MLWRSCQKNDQKKMNSFSYLKSCSSFLTVYSSMIHLMTPSLASFPDHTLNIPSPCSHLPAPLPPAAGGRFGGPGGDDLTVDGSQQQHEPDGSEHLCGRYPMRLRDGDVQHCCCHCEEDKRQGKHLGVFLNHFQRPESWNI